MHQSDKRFKNWTEKTARKCRNPRKYSFVYLKLLLNSKKFGKTLMTKKLWDYYIFPTVDHMHHLDKWFVNQPQNNVRRNMKLWCSAEKFTWIEGEVHLPPYGNLLLI
jgi:hypothetical protein